MSIGSAKAKEILKALSIDKPELLSHLREICIERGVFVREGVLDAAEARLTVGSEQGIILVSNSENQYATRTRFSIAHELGHWELHKDIANSIECDKRAMNEWFGSQKEKTREIQANEFASELLLPEIFLEREIKKTGPSFSLIRDIADRYETSLTATARRFVSLTPEACALVFFAKDKSLYSFRSPLFEKQAYWIKPGPLDQYSYAYDVAQGKAGEGRMSSVDATTWIDTSDWPQWKKDKLEDKSIQEEALFFETLGFGMSLIWIKDPSLIWN